DQQFRVDRVAPSSAFFFFQAEAGIRDGHMTGVQTCALPISSRDAVTFQAIEREAARLGQVVGDLLTLARADAGERPIAQVPLYRSEERRVGTGGRVGGAGSRVVV